MFCDKYFCCFVGAVFQILIHGNTFKVEGDGILRVLSDVGCLGIEGTSLYVFVKMR